MKENILVSILIPVYNRVNFIVEAVESCMIQSYKNIEIIVIDNFSTDGTYEKVLECQKKDTRITIVRNEKNVGRVENWNIALRHINGAYFQFFMSDDKLDKDAIKDKIEAVKKHNNLVIVSSGHKCFPSNYEYCHFKEETIIEGMDAYKSIMKSGNWLAGLNNNMFRTRSMIECGGFDTQLTWGADWNFYFAMLKKGNVAYIPKMLSYFREHDGRMSDKGLVQSFYEDWIVRKMAYMTLYYKNEPFITLLRSKLQFVLLSINFFLEQNKVKRFGINQKIKILFELGKSIGVSWVVFGLVVFFLKELMKKLLTYSTRQKIKYIVWGKA